ncbi:hypothetical protein [Microlunatus ginsengisoli]
MASSVQLRGRAVRDPSRRRPVVAVALAAVQALVAVNAVIGGWQLIATGFGIPPEWLARTPFSGWVWPGVLLWLTVGVPQFVGVGAALVRTPWWPQIGWRVGLLTGAGLLAWILVQLAVLQHYFFLQPVIAGVGLVEIALAVGWRHLATSRLG